MGLRQAEDNRHQVAQIIVFNVGHLGRQHVPGPHKPGLAQVEQARSGTEGGPAFHVALHGLAADGESLAPQDVRVPRPDVGRQLLVALHAPQARGSDGYVLGGAHRTAGAVVVNGPLHGEAGFAGEFLALDQGSQVLVGLHRNGPPVVIGTGNGGEGMLSAEFGSRVVRHYPAQQGQLDVPGTLGALHQAAVPPRLGQVEAGPQQGVAGAVRKAAHPVDRLPAALGGQGSNSRTKGLRIWTKNPRG